jgi:hypothetical protein
MRKSFSPEVTRKVALVALKEEMNKHELSSKYEVHKVQIGRTNVIASNWAIKSRKRMA